MISISTHLAASLRLKRSDDIYNDVISLILQIEMCSFAEKKLEKELHTIHNSVIFK